MTGWKNVLPFPCWGCHVTLGYLGSGVGGGWDGLPALPHVMIDEVEREEKKSDKAEI
jgi:hypothetical protein